MATATQLANIRANFEITTQTGPYAGEVAQFGVSIGIERGNDKWDRSTPFYRGRSGSCRTVWHEVTTTHYDATIQWEADLDDGAGRIDAAVQDDVFAAAFVFGKALMGYVPSSSALTAITLSPRTHTGAVSKGSTGTACGASRAVITPGQAPGMVGQALPPEVACALSMYGVGNLRTSRGRLYFGPLAQPAITASGTLSPTMLPEVAGYLKTFLEALHQLHPDAGGSPSTDALIPWVFNPYPSSVIGDDYPKGSPIASVRYDNRPDSQRRREATYTPTKTVLPLGGW